MALTRKMLKDAGIADDVIDQIMEAHGETVAGLKAERDSFKATAGKADDLQRQLSEKADNENWKKKYEDMEKDYNNYKGTVSAKETAKKKEAAYKKLLQKSKISEKRLDSILKVTDFSGIELNEDGTLKDAENIEKKINEEWADFKVTENQTGSNPPTPLANETKSFTRDDIEKMSVDEINKNYSDILKSLKG